VTPLLGPADSARNVDIIFGDTLSFEEFCRKKSASVAALHIRFLSKIRDHLSCDFTSRLCMSLVLSRLNCYNYLLAGLPRYSVLPCKLLQIWQHASY